MSLTNIALLCIGWASYWLAKSAQFAKDNSGTARDFALQNVYEFCTSVLGCAAIILLAKQISPGFVDLSAGGSVLGAGYGSSSFINTAMKLAKGAKPKLPIVLITVFLYLIVVNQCTQTEKLTHTARNGQTGCWVDNFLDGRKQVCGTCLGKQNHRYIFDANGWRMSVDSARIEWK